MSDEQTPAPLRIPGLARLNTWPVKGALLVLVAVLFFYFLGEIKSGVRNLGSRAADARSEKIVKEETDAATSHESNANAASVDRQINEARAADAQAAKDAAARNSNLTAEPARRARQTYEKTRRHDPADAPPAIPDDELCSELEKRGIPCPR